MNQLSIDILEVLKQHDIERKDMYNQLNMSLMEIQYSLWETISLSPYVFYMFKDTVYYNFEVCRNLEEPFLGKSNIATYGKYYPNLMFNIDIDGFMEAEYVKGFVEELEDIEQRFNKKIVVADMDGDYNFDWNINGDNSTKIIFYDKINEKPSKYGYKVSGNKYSGVLDITGTEIISHEDTILCPIYKVDEDREYKLLQNLLQSLISVAKKALENDKGIQFNLNDYNF